MLTARFGDHILIHSESHLMEGSPRGALLIMLKMEYIEALREIREKVGPKLILDAIAPLLNNTNLNGALSPEEQRVLQMAWMRSTQGAALLSEAARELFEIMDIKKAYSLDSAHYLSGLFFGGSLSVQESKNNVLFNDLRILAQQIETSWALAEKLQPGQQELQGDRRILTLSFETEGHAYRPEDIAEFGRYLDEMAEVLRILAGTEETGFQIVAIESSNPLNFGISVQEIYYALACLAALTVIGMFHHNFTVVRTKDRLDVGLKRADLELKVIELRKKRSELTEEERRDINGIMSLLIHSNKILPEVFPDLNKKSLTQLITENFRPAPHLIPKQGLDSSSE